jgi:hypothetical protein
MPIFEPTFEALNRADVRYVVVGGVAVVLHGHPRLTADLDLVVNLAPAEARTAIEALTALGLRPTIPVDPADFADPVKRSQWVSEKNMLVFSLVDPADPVCQVDLFVESPIEFEQFWKRSQVVDLAGTTVRIASIDDLLSMKRAAGGLRTWPTSTRSRTSGETGARMDDVVEDERAQPSGSTPGRTVHDDGWVAARRAQRRRQRRTTPVQRLAWLEDAIAFAERAGRCTATGRRGHGRGENGPVLSSPRSVRRTASGTGLGSGG